jgi:hypothetical protein
MIDIPRGRHIGQRIGELPNDEAEHFMRCLKRNAWDRTPSARLLRNEVALCLFPLVVNLLRKLSDAPYNIDLKFVHPIAVLLSEAAARTGTYDIKITQSKFFLFMYVSSQDQFDAAAARGLDDPVMIS